MPPIFAQQIGGATDKRAQKLMNIIHCAICGRELTNEVSITKGIGPVCRGQVLERERFYNGKKCNYRIELIHEERICIIHELYDPKKPSISLTNCIEHVIAEIVTNESLCTNSWTFIEHANNKGNMFGEYHEFDLVDVSGASLFWKYIWHSDAKGETKIFSNDLIIDRVNKYKAGAKIVIE